MKLAWSADDEAFRAELVAFLDANTPAEAIGGYDFFGDTSDEGQIIPPWLRSWQATLFDHGWMIPGYPPELGGRNCTPVQTLIYLEEMAPRAIPRSLHFPGYAIVAPSPFRLRIRRHKGLGAGRDPRRHDLVHRHERTQRGFRPRRAPDAPKCATTTSSSTARRSGRATRRSPRSASATYVHDRERRSTADQPPHHDRHGHTRYRHPPAPPHQRHGGIRGGVLHRRGRSPREPRRRPQRRLADHPGLARARAGRAVGRERRPARAHHPIRAGRAGETRGPRR